MSMQLNPALNQWAHIGVAGKSITPILDQITGAVCAFGLRKLRAAYAGSAIQVRRSSDNVTQDIGFLLNGSLDTTSLLSFLGSNSGFIAKWYDQSGNGNDAAQATNGSQPRIVNAGTTDTQNSKPALFFDGSASTLTIATPLSSTKSVAGMTVNMVAQSANASVQQYLFEFATGTVATNARIGIQKSSANQIQGIARALDGDSGAFYGSGTDGASYEILTNVVNYATPLGSLFKNGVSQATGSSGITAGNTDSTNSLVMRLGARGTSAANFLSGYMSEFIFYASALSAVNHKTIERDQGSYYGISVS